MDASKPSLELLRSLTDEHVLRALMRHRRLTRAELAAEIGISKPTAGESVRRLAEAGVVIDTGERTRGGRGRGRVGSYYALAENVGTALAVSIAPEGIVAECVDAYGETIARAARTISRPARSEQVDEALRAAVAAARHTLQVPPRLAVVSAADPVDRTTGRLVHLPDAPFLLGELDPVEVLAPLVEGPVAVDNDVNWAAQAERDRDPTLTDFVYLYLDEGLGGAIVNDGEVRRGGSGLAGEIAHLITIGPEGQAIRLIEVFGELGLRQHDSTAIDVDRLLATVTESETTGRVLAQAVSGVLAAVAALVDPALVIVGGSWGSDPVVLTGIREAAERLPRRIPIHAAHLVVEPSLTGARRDALARLRASIVATPQDRRIDSPTPAAG